MATGCHGSQHGRAAAFNLSSSSQVRFAFYFMAGWIFLFFWEAKKTVRSRPCLVTASHHRHGTTAHVLSSMRKIQCSTKGPVGLWYLGLMHFSPSARPSPCIDIGLNWLSEANLWATFKVGTAVRSCRCFKYANCVIHPKIFSIYASVSKNVSDWLGKSN